GPGEDRVTLEKIATDRAPKAIGPYSQAIRSGDLIFCAGQVGLDPATGEAVQGDVKVQTARILDNLAGVLAAAGSDLAHVLKTTGFLTDMGDFAAMNAIYAQQFGDHRPARSTIGLAPLPRGRRVAIAGTATNR